MYKFIICSFFLLTASLAHAGPPNPTSSDIQDNTAGGREALIDTGEGARNTAFGSLTMRVNTTGKRNSAFGAGALYSTNGENNTAVGFLSLGESSTGWYNTSHGYYSLGNLQRGWRNTAIGSGSGVRLVHGNNNVYLSNPGVPKENLTLRLGDVQTRAFIKGVANTSLSGKTVVINSAGQLGVSASSSAEALLPQVLEELEAQAQLIDALMKRVETLTQQAAH